MKHLLLIASLLAVACQPQARTEPAKAAPHPASIVGSVAAATLAKTATAVAGLAPVESLSPKMRQILQGHDLSPLLQTVGSGDAHAQNGFFVPDHYRIEMAFTDVRRDPAHPTVYLLRGKDRYKGRITAFTGTLTVTRFGEQLPDPAAQLATGKKDFTIYDEPRMYSTEGRFELREESAQRGAGIFAGKVNIDWRIVQDKSLDLHTENPDSPSQEGLIKYEGTWTNATTQRIYPVVWVEDFDAYNAHQNILAEFNVGERGLEVNPKYAKLGWNKYWENTEWWTDSKPKTKPAANASAEAADTITSLGI